MKNIIIVESPAKCKTISKYLGEDYTVVSSKGHIRDLATSGKYGLGIDIENDFKPNYEIIKGKKKDVKYLKDLISEEMNQEYFGNGRFISNLYARIEEKMAINTEYETDINRLLSSRF